MCPNSKKRLETVDATILAQGVAAHGQPSSCSRAVLSSADNGEEDQKYMHVTASVLLVYTGL